MVVPLNVVAVLGGLVQALRESRLRTAGRSVEAFLVWILVLGVGVGGLLAFMVHTAMADSTARSIGWPIGNPFQYEVAVANLAIGALGILCYWIRGGCWTATVVAASVWLLGGAAIHVQQIVAVGNYPPTTPGYRCTSTS